MQDTQTTVETDTNKDKFVSYYLLGIGVVGAGLIAGGAALDWGFYAYGGGALLMVAGFGGLAGKRAQGGFAKAACPGCGESLTFQFSKVARIMRCDACGAWSEGTETMALVPDDRVADYPAFMTPMPPKEDGLTWPTGADGATACPMCGGPSTGVEKLEGSDMIGLAAAAVAPVSVRRVYSIEAPICAEHKDGVALFVNGTDLSLGFRSRAYQLRFEAANR